MRIREGVQCEIEKLEKVSNQIDGLVWLCVVESCVQCIGSSIHGHLEVDHLNVVEDVRSHGVVVPEFVVPSDRFNAGVQVFITLMRSGT